MNDSAIIRAISKIHSVIINLLIFIFIALFLIYFTLHIGLKLNTFILPGIKIEQLYIKWDEKIAVDIGSIKITKGNSGKTFDIKSLDPKTLLEQSHILDTFFSDISIRNIEYAGLNATFSYMEHVGGHLNIDGPALKLAATVRMNDRLMLVDVKELKESTTKSMLRAKLLIDSSNAKLYGDLNLNAADVMPLKLYLLADQAKVQLWGKGTEPFTRSIKPAVRIAHLHPKVEPWVADYHQGKAIHLEYFKGTLVYDNPITLLDTLDAKLRYDEVQYVFAPGYAPVIAEYADVTFKDRVLNIYPREATYYGQPGEKTWLKIDFSNPSHPLLTVDVDTSAQLTEEMLPWLQGYGIRLPFYQKKGKTTVKLAIWVELNNIHVGAEGSFKTEEAAFNFSGTDIQVKNVIVNLKNTDIDIQKLNASLLKNAINADIAGQLNPVTKKGRFAVSLNRMAFENSKSVFGMDPQQKGVDFEYIIDGKSDRLKIPKSYWRFNQKLVTINPVSANFDFATLSGDIPTTLVSSEDLLKCYVTGHFNIKKLETELTVDLLSLKTPSLSLYQSSVPLEIRYKEGLYLNLKTRSDWRVGDSTFTLYPSILSYKSNLIYIQDAHFALGDLLDSQLSGAYNTLEKRGKFTLHKLEARSDRTLLFKTRRKVPVTVNESNGIYFVKVPSLDLDYQQNSAEWNVSINDINKISKLSPFLSENNITTGNIRLYAHKDTDTVNLGGTIPYPYRVLTKNNIPVQVINFNGTYANKQLAVTVNDDVQATLKHTRLNIKAKDTGFNLAAIYDFIKDHPASDTNQTKSRFKANIEADNSYLYINESRRVPADKLLLQYANGDLNAQLFHGKNGGAALEYSNQKIFIYGDGLNDTFMDGIAEFSDFRGGNLSFYVLGTINDLEGVVQVKDTIVKDYKVISNIFSFINTIPALVTFSVPQYTTKGLKVYDAYAGFTIKDGMMTVKGFHINAEELVFNGKGSVDLNEKSLDIETTLVTDATTNLAKIPLIGYILVGKEENKVMTTITLTGALNNPKVENTLAKDIAIAPFNILKRALTFPVHYLDEAQKAIKENGK